MGDHQDDLDRRHRRTTTLHAAIARKVLGHPAWWQVIDHHLDHRYRRATNPSWLDAYARWPWKQDALADWAVTAAARDTDRLWWAATDRSSHAEEMRRTHVTADIITDRERHQAFAEVGYDVGPYRYPGKEPEMADTGITWDPERLGTAAYEHVGVDAALASFRERRVEKVAQLADLDGIGFTERQVASILATGEPGDSLGERVLALRDAAVRLEELVADGIFGLRRFATDTLHLIAARHDPTEAGRFRGEGHRQGGEVLYTDGGRVHRASSPGDRGLQMRIEFREAVAFLETQPRIDQGLAYQRIASRRRFTFECNGSVPELMASGLRLAAGFVHVASPR